MNSIHHNHRSSKRYPIADLRYACHGQAVPLVRISGLTTAEYSCKEKKIIYNRMTQSRRLHPPDIPEEAWSDFRCDYESGMTLKMISEKYLCDPRTVRKCIMTNRSSSEIGRQFEPTKVAAYVEQIDSLYQEYILLQQTSHKKLGICDISRKITKILADEGYTGSERTVRNYLRNTYQFVTDPDEPWEEI